MLTKMNFATRKYIVKSLTGNDFRVKLSEIFTAPHFSGRSWGWEHSWFCCQVLKCHAGTLVNSFALSVASYLCNGVNCSLASLTRHLHNIYFQVKPVVSFHFHKWMVIIFYSPPLL